MERKNIGSYFDEVLQEDGNCEEVTAAAAKRVLARQSEREKVLDQLVAEAQANEMGYSLS